MQILMQEWKDASNSCHITTNFTSTQSYTCAIVKKASLKLGVFLLVFAFQDILLKEKKNQKRKMGNFQTIFSIVLFVQQIYSKFYHKNKPGKALYYSVAK